MAISRCGLLNLGARVGEDDEGSWQREFSAILQQELLQFTSFVTHGLEPSIDGVDDQNNFNGRIVVRGRGAIHCLKRENVLRPFVVEKSEVLLLQSANGCARFVRYLHVELDSPVRGR